MPFPTQIQFVTRAEEVLGRRLPAAYVARMLRGNGGTIKASGDEWTLIPIYDDSDRKHVKRTFSDIVRETASAKQWQGFPEDAVVVAQNGSGDFLVLLPDKVGAEFDEAVYAWNHETAELSRIADTFADLDAGHDPR